MYFTSLDRIVCTMLKKLHQQCTEIKRETSIPNSPPFLLKTIIIAFLILLTKGHNPRIFITEETQDYDSSTILFKY